MYRYTVTERHLRCACSHSRDSRSRNRYVSSFVARVSVGALSLPRPHSPHTSDFLLQLQCWDLQGKTVQPAGVPPYIRQHDVAHQHPTIHEQSLGAPRSAFAFKEGWVDNINERLNFRLSRTRSRGPPSSCGDTLRLTRAPMVKHFTGN